MKTRSFVVFSLILVVTHCVLPIEAVAEKVPLARVQAVSHNWMKLKETEIRRRGNVPLNKGPLGRTVLEYHPIVENADTLLHLFTFQSGGFVILSGDDRFPPVLGYSLTNPFPGTNTPPSVVAWLEGLKEQLSLARKGNVVLASQARGRWEALSVDPTQFDEQNVPVTMDGSVSPLVQTTWDQGMYYNELCPIDAAGPGGHAPVGCTATAMGQILRHWSYPEGGIGQHDYIGKSTGAKYGRISAYFNLSDYNWSAMPHTLSSSNPEVARLLFHCGVSADMDYGPTGSSAYLNKAGLSGLIRYFDYDTSLTFVQRSAFPDSQWLSLLKADLEGGRPILYAGYNSSLSLGHAFVCDGYQGIDFFHFNFGWSGAADGYYYLGTLVVGFYNFNYHQEAIMGIHPRYSPLSARFTTRETTLQFQFEFIDYSTGNPTAWLWDFGDGTTSTEQNPEHTYGSEGQYTVRLTATKNGSQSVSSKIFDVKSASFSNNLAVLQGVAGVVRLGDYDNDNDLDLLLIGYPLGNVLYQNVNGQFVPQYSAGLDPGTGFSTRFSDSRWADFDNDGYLDILFLGNQGSKIYRNRRNGTFEEWGADLPAAERVGCDVGDYNGDGWPDIALSGTILRNEHNGEFSDIRPGFAFIWAPPVVAWGDFDNDGDLDLFAATIYNSKLFRNDGGIFVDTQISLPPHNEKAAVCCDIDNDGDLDLLMVGHDGWSDHFRIARNLGNLTFETLEPSVLPALEQACLTVGDYNSDGTKDILVGGHTSTSMTSQLLLFENLGACTFQPVSAPELPGISTPGLYDVAWGDFDNDEDLDIFLCGAHSTGGLTFYTQLWRNNIAHANGAPTPPIVFTARVDSNDVVLSWSRSTDDTTPVDALSYNLALGTPVNATAVLSPMSDLTSGFRRLPRGGNADLCGTARFSNIPNGTYIAHIQAVDNSFVGSIFSPPITFQIDGANLAPHVLDFSIAGTLHAAKGFTESDFRSRFLDPEGDSLKSIQISTLQLSGVLELGGIPVSEGQVVNATQLGQLMYTPSGLANGKFFWKGSDGSNWSKDSAAVEITVGLTSPMNTSVPVGSNGASVWGDFDNDGDLDVLITGDSLRGAISAILRNDQGSFVDIGANLQPLSNSRAAWGDFDSDGDLDLVIAGIAYDGVTGVVTKLYRNDGMNVFTDIHAPIVGLDFGAVAWGDYDNDNKLDLAITGIIGESPYTRLTRIYHNKGNSVFEEITTGIPGTTVGSLDWGDFDNDGDLDLLITGSQGTVENSITHVYRNVGNGQFLESNLGLPGFCNGTGKWGDYDADGDLDILVTGFNSSIGAGCHIYRNDSTGFVESGMSFPRVRFGGAEWIDFDNDGKLDVVVTGTTYDDWGHPSAMTKLYAQQDAGLFVEVRSGILPLSYGVISCADVDGDGDPDFMVNGADASNSLAGGLFRNMFRDNQFHTNLPPSIPIDLSVRVVNDVAFVSWSPASDQATPSAALTYNLRIGTDPTGGQVLSPMSQSANGYRLLPEPGNVGGNTYHHIKGLPPGDYYAAVQSVDNSALASPFSVASAFRVDPVTVVSTVTAATGWNLVSVPVGILDSSVTALFPSAVSDAYGFETGYVAVGKVTPGAGYWLKFSEADTFVFSGSRVFPRDITVHAGWNMIGTFENPVSVSGISSIPPSIVVSEFYSYLNGYSPTSALLPGAGYWVKANQVGVLSFSETIPKAAATKATLAANSARIIVRDSAGIERTVYLLSGAKINPSSQLPPVPPRGVMDVRFETQSAYDTLEQARHVLLLSSVVSPFTVFGRNLGGRSYALSYGFGDSARKTTLNEQTPVIIPTTLGRLEMEEVVIRSETIPTEYTLHQNYPNPFNPSTTIHFGLPARSQLTLTVFNTLGQQVAELANGEFEAGYHEVRFNGMNLASGVYLYRLRAGNYVATKKLLLVK
jgi:PKD repeat protein